MPKRPVSNQTNHKLVPVKHKHTPIFLTPSDATELLLERYDAREIASAVAASFELRARHDSVAGTASALRDLVSHDERSDGRWKKMKPPEQVAYVKDAIEKAMDVGIQFGDFLCFDDPLLKYMPAGGRIVVALGSTQSDIFISKNARNASQRNPGLVPNKVLVSFDIEAFNLISQAIGAARRYEMPIEVAQAPDTYSFTSDGLGPGEWQAELAAQIRSFSQRFPHSSATFWVGSPVSNMASVIAAKAIVWGWSDDKLPVTLTCSHKYITWPAESQSETLLRISEGDPLDRPRIERSAVKSLFGTMPTKDPVGFVAARRLLNGQLLILVVGADQASTTLAAAAFARGDLSRAMMSGAVDHAKWCYVTTATAVAIGNLPSPRLNEDPFRGLLSPAMTDDDPKDEGREVDECPKDTIGIQVIFD
jgi:hypothetical protein